MSPSMDMGWLQGTPDKAQAQMLPKSLRLWGQGKPMAGLHPPNGAESLWEPLLGSKVFWGEGAAGRGLWWAYYKLWVTISVAAQTSKP